MTGTDNIKGQQILRIQQRLSNMIKNLFRYNGLKSTYYVYLSNLFYKPVYFQGFCSLLSLVGVIVFTVGICRKICRQINRQPGDNGMPLHNSSESSSPNNESNDSNGHQASHQPVCENGTPSQTGSASFSPKQANNSSITTPQANGETKESTKV